MFKYFKKRRYVKELNNPSINYYLAYIFPRTGQETIKARQVLKDYKKFFKIVKPYRVRNNSVTPKLFTTLYLGEGNDLFPEKGFKPEKFNQSKILVRVPEGRADEFKLKFNEMKLDTSTCLVSLSHIYHEQTYSGLFNRIYYKSKEIPRMEGSECDCEEIEVEDDDEENFSCIEPEYHIPPGGTILSRCSNCGEIINFLTNKETKKIRKRFEDDLFKSFYHVLDNSHKT